MFEVELDDNNVICLSYDGEWFGFDDFCNGDAEAVEAFTTAYSNNVFVDLYDHTGICMNDLVEAELWN